MAASANFVTLTGRVGKDPNVRTMNNGEKVVSFSMATSETWKDKQTGERKEKTDWHDIVIFNQGLVEIAEKYVNKGSLIQVFGKLEKRKWQDQSGADRYSVEVVLPRFKGELFLLGRPDGGDVTGGGERRSSSGNEVGTSRRSVTQQDEEDIPF